MRARIGLGNTALVVTGVLSGLLAGEAATRVLFKPRPWVDAVLDRVPMPANFELLPDREWLYQPAPGAGYDPEWGTLLNTYPREKKAGTRRILFVGDSVTHRAKIIDSLKKIYGELDKEYWNAGVEGYNTVQEWKYFVSKNEKSSPDEIVISFHNNDFDPGVVIYKDSRFRIQALAFGQEPRAISSFGIFHCTLYQFWVDRVLLAQMQGRAWKRGPLFGEVKEALRSFQAWAKNRNVNLSVLLLPVFDPPERWRPDELRSRQEAIRILNELGIRYFDLLIPLREALARNLPVQENPGDSLHPSRSVADEMAGYLRRQRFLEDAPTNR